MDAHGGSLLAVARSRERSVVTRARSVAPLRLLVPVSPGPAAWVYQSSLGGGFVGADAIELEVEVAAGARLFLTSQASGKVYRGAASRCRLDAAIGEDAVLIAWPDPLACFAGAAFEQRQRFRLARSAGVICVDAWTAGRIAHGERWAFDTLALVTEIEIDGERVVTEALRVSPRHGALAARMGDAQAFATIVIAGEAFADVAAAIARDVAARPPATRPLIAASAWPWGAIVRLAAATTEALVAAIRDLIGPPVAGALGADPLARKW
ncbi:MAG TPA: urease accessory protein UreD [Kofleriaceae bacterium]|nr:urease accessory protein UreD [Kofleriaceae bacterium]